MRTLRLLKCPKNFPRKNKKVVPKIGTGIIAIRNLLTDFVQNLAPRRGQSLFGANFYLSQNTPIIEICLIKSLTKIYLFCQISSIRTLHDAYVAL